jgi:hypothetical protein
MRKILASTLAAVTAAGAVMATAAPAQADGYRYHRHHDNDDAVAAAVIGGVAGLALGAALSGGSHSRYYDGGYYRSYPYRGGAYYDRGYYDRGYYGGRYYSRPYAYDDYDRPRVCISRDRVWDPYIGRRVVIERRYAC